MNQSLLNLYVFPEFVNKYQDPAAADFGDVHKGLKDTTEVLFKAFDQVIARGEKLEVLTNEVMMNALPPSLDFISESLLT